MAPPLFLSLFCLLQDEILILLMLGEFHITVFIDVDVYIDVGFLSGLGTFGLYGCSAQLDTIELESLYRLVLTLIADEGTVYYFRYI